ncbi:hypothetical protein [Laspinema olomoucense]|uniref:Uncharacterized protein n=1 Tax=Laspinema olomoucense D3b TaxID=2953688 RepID=A0ABT2NA49_9CYAN|nr:MULTISPECIES: hypothetical protein [unclassified Laspinema]MCT7979336.1 hypothetical protein [Laspinema sp. D3b]MCT7989135.1 hypothetical protein [Laspinema sp. D3a]
MRDSTVTSLPPVMIRAAIATEDPPHPRRIQGLRPEPTPDSLNSHCCST